MRCAQLKERTVKREAGLTPVGLQSIRFAFAVMKLKLSTGVKYQTAYTARGNSASCGCGSVTSQCW